MPARTGSGPLGGAGSVSPLGVLAALVIVGITIEVVERQNKMAAYGLVALLLLGMITFNAAAFRTQITNLLAVLNAKKGASSTPQAQNKTTS